MNTKLFIDVEFDAKQTDAQQLATAADTLSQMSSSTSSVLDEFSNPQFGEFFSDEGESCRDRIEQESETDESCPQDDGGHEPDWTSAHVEFDGEAYLDVNCKHCGRSGCIGSEKSLTEQISW